MFFKINRNKTKPWSCTCNRTKLLTSCALSSWELFVAWAFNTCTNHENGDLALCVAVLRISPNDATQWICWCNLVCIHFHLVRANRCFQPVPYAFHVLLRPWLHPDSTTTENDVVLDFYEGFLWHKLISRFQFRAKYFNSRTKEAQLKTGWTFGYVWHPESEVDAPFSVLLFVILS